MAPNPPRNFNTGPMLASPRCGARTRAGTPCQAPAVKGKKRCRMHGGAAGSGAPRGNQNALKHGRYAAEGRRKERQRRRGFRGLGVKIPIGLGPGKPRI
jgi:hypothetical protein